MKGLHANILRVDDRIRPEGRVVCVVLDVDSVGEVATTFTPARAMPLRCFMQAADLEQFSDPGDAVGRAVVVDLEEQRVVSGPDAGRMVNRVVRWRREKKSRRLGVTSQPPANAQQASGAK